MGDDITLYLALVVVTVGVLLVLSGVAGLAEWALTKKKPKRVSNFKGVWK